MIVKSTGTGKKAFVFGILSVFVLAAGLALGVFLVSRQQSQDIRSKAAGCDMRWPAKPGTACANKLSPAMDATNVSLTPDFIWDYGGYRDGENGDCVEPSGCTGYYANVIVWEGSDKGTEVMRCGAVIDSNGNPPKSCNWVSFYHNEPLKPNTDYWWRVEPGSKETSSHADQTWDYHFKTGGETTAPTASCQNVTADKDLSSVKIGDTVTFTGKGTVTDSTDSIDEINFIILNGTTSVFNDNAPATLDSGNTYKATKSITINSAGSYSVRIRVHQKTADKWYE